MRVALIDNGSLEPAAHANLRAVASALSNRCAVEVHAVSWKHSDLLPPGAGEQGPAWTMADFVRFHFAQGERDFVFVPFFISAQGAIGSALRQDIEKLRASLGGFRFTFTRGLAAVDHVSSVVRIVADCVRSTVKARELQAPPVIIVDHGGPSLESATLRNAIADGVRALGPGLGPVVAASMEGAAHAHNRPLLADQLAAPGFDRGDVVIAPLFLSPGRHAGAGGDLAGIVRAAEDRLASPALHCHFTGLVGTHPLAAEALSAALRETLSSFHAEIPA